MASLSGRLARRLVLPSRCWSSGPPGHWTHRLPGRGALRIRGAGSADFLQGLVTNDMRHFEDGARSIYAMMLNTKGRVLFDLVMYRYDSGDASPAGGGFLLEADRSLLGKLQSLLKIYRVRRKIDVDDVSDSVCFLAVREVTADAPAVCPAAPDCTEHGRAVHTTSPLELSLPPDTSDVMAASRDPRLSALGWRLVLSSSADPDALLSGAVPGAEDPALLRYRLGVSEGADEVPHAGCTPLEYNCDYLHGVSFHKGCYVGQELTARTHHTGVVRKRLMPLQFSAPPPDGMVGASVLDAASGKTVGKVRAMCGSLGLGLMRIDESLASGRMVVAETECEVTTQRPSWWPVQATKERRG